MSDTLLREFDKSALLYSRVTEKAASLIRELLIEYNVAVHSVTCRTKTRASLEKKLSKQGRAYKNLSEITDISGVRIITYFEDDVDRVVEVLEKEFLVDSENSVDKRKLMDPERFGYLSTHHVVRLSPARSGLHEYKWIEEKCFEIQTRSILQHAWAEIEHDLGYKSASEIPKNVRRRFSRLASLLELADSEFAGIRGELWAYERKVEGKIKTAPEEVGVDRNSLVAFVRESDIVASLDVDIAKHADWTLVDEEDPVAQYASRFVQFGINTIADLKGKLIENSILIEKFAVIWLQLPDEEDEPELDGEIHKGISLFYLLYVLLAQKGDLNVIKNYFKVHGIGPDDPSATAQSVIDIYESIK